MAITLTICESANIAVNPVVPATVTINPSIPSVTATVTVGTTTTGAPGTDAEVVNSGTPYAAILDFTIPEGIQGIPGPQGTSGVAYATAPLSYNAGTKTISINLSAYARLASPTFTGDPKAPTPATSDNDTSIATTAFVKAQGYITSSALSPYLLSATAASTYQPIGSYLTDAPNNGSPYVRKSGAWEQLIIS